ncbi:MULTISPECIES: alpha/beta fold hydrolase [unclassified Streptomyces]|uniref:alpha/beta fold hydrolase n=1 Tax=unclassified Streptomyces TaxID=2593676 RepID=UPI0036E92FC8
MLDGFEDGYAEVNGTRLHYKAGGDGAPLVIMDGWPRTSHGLHKIMPLLAERFRVIAVDYRGMGQSDKPKDGYDKKNMAKDLHQLVHELGHEQVNLAGGDVGAMVAYAFAANYPDATRKLALWEGGPFSQIFLDVISPFPKPGEPNAFWYPLSQIDDLPQKLLTGRFRHIIDWTAEHLALHPERISEESRALYTAAYNEADAVHAAFALYRTFHQDLADNESYPPLDMPVLGIGAQHIGVVRESMAGKASDIRFSVIEDSGHYIAEENPRALADELVKFFG